MNGQYIWVGLLAAVPIAVIVVVLALRGYDISLILKRGNKKKDDEE